MNILLFIRIVLLVISISSALRLSAQSSEGIRGEPNALLGKSGTSGTASLDAGRINPAQNAWLPYSRIEVRWGAVYSDFRYRYPGFKGKQQSNFALQPGLPMPNFGIKLGPSFYLSGVIVPLNLSLKISYDQVPLVVFGQESQVSIDANAKLKGFADLSVGHRASRYWSWGVKIHYLDIEAQGDVSVLSDSGGGSPLLKFRLAQKDIDLTPGFLAKFPSKGAVLSLGASLSVYRQQVLGTTTEFVSANEAENSGGDQTFSESFSTARVGVGYESLRYLLGVDIKYQRKNAGQRRYSIRSLKELPLDSYDTVSLFAGQQWRLSPATRLLNGAFFEPSSIGQGKKGQESGYGFFDLIGESHTTPNKPVWGVSMGLQHRFCLDPSDGSSSRPLFRCEIEGGLVYSQLSVGIDQDGEQPGAYHADRFLIPVKFGYVF